MAEPNPLLRRAAERAQRHPTFLASLLLPFATAEALDDAALARRLGCPLSSLPTLLLCQRPRPDQLVSDLQRIATHCQADLLSLTETIRLAESLQHLAAGQAASPFLAAARDRTDPPPPDPEPPSP